MIEKANCRNVVSLSTSLFLINTAVVGAASLLMWMFLPEDGYFYGFFFRCWPVQVLNSWLFVLGVIIFVRRLLLIRDEEDAVQSLQLPNVQINADRARRLIRVIPEDRKHTLIMGRFTELLRAYINKEDVIRFNEELSRRDIEEIDRNHLVLNNLRNIIPVIGFLGTVLGLSLGMMRFPSIASDSQSIESLKRALEGFAADLSMAFDTTLLALAFTIVIILLASFLRHREELLVSMVDEMARTLIGHIKAAADQDGEASGPKAEVAEWLQAFRSVIDVWKEEFSSVVMELFERQYSKNGKYFEGVENILERNGERLVAKLDELGTKLRRPPQYKVVVQPLNGDGGDEK